MPANDRWDRGDILDGFRQPQYAEIEATPGLELIHTGSNTMGKVAGFSEGDRVVLVDPSGNRHVFRAHDGAFRHRGQRVALRAPTVLSSRQSRFTASGSAASPHRRAQVAAPSRIWVEGTHDAELIEKIWGDDLRSVGIVVEPLHGVDHLADAVRDFAPTESRRLGVLLDHVVAGSKEHRIAANVTDANVLILGHPFVDIWAAILPATIGIDAWPDVPPGMPWKEGVIHALGMSERSGAFWGRVLDSVTTYRDLETPLVNAVEQLIDFVTVA